MPELANSKSTTTSMPSNSRVMRTVASRPLSCSSELNTE
jgi:hypothetical protein